MNHRNFDIDINDNYEEFIRELSKGSNDPKVQASINLLMNSGKYSIEAEDDVINVSDLIPTQNEIDLDKSLKYPLTNKFNSISSILDNDVVVINKTPIITMNGKYIIDGHHRWSQVYCLNPDAKMRSINILSDNHDPIEMLKIIQMEILNVTGDVPSATVDGINIYDISKSDIRSYINDTLTSEAEEIFIDKLGDDFIDILVDNVIDMKNNNKPIKNAPDRSYMPQTDRDNSAVITKLLSGDVKDPSTILINHSRSLSDEELFDRYVRVQAEGKYNMITEASSAMKAAKLTKAEYFYVIQNYELFSEEYPHILEKWGM